MVLEERPLSAYNAMVGRIAKGQRRQQKIGRDTSDRPVKRLKKNELGESDSNDQLSDLENRVTPSKPRQRDAPDSEAESCDEKPVEVQQTDIEKALPPVNTDKDAIEEYEAFRASEGTAAKELEERLGKRHWVKGKSSIYVDAFNLALETVLEDESHLFDEAEMQVFIDWRALSYEAQYLYVVHPLRELPY